jgi:hypothetical protein
MDKLSADLLVSLTGLAISFLAFYIPPFRKLVDSLGEWKFGFMALTMLLVAVIYSVSWCNFDIQCLKTDISSILMIWIAGLGMNQSTYQIAIKRQVTK